jgi:predicted amino acid racemase
MKTPGIEINLGKIAHNAKILKELYGSKGIDVVGVTKVVCGDPAVAKVLVKSGINILADSRIENIVKMHDADIHAQFLLLRTPLSQSESVVKYADISLNSELSVIKELSKYAVKQGVTHKIILMVELGDLREGIMPSDLENTVNEVIGLKGIELAGIGTNLACFGGIKPNNEKMDSLSSIVKNIEDKFKLKLEIISGGNSANYNWFMTTKNVGRINNLRLGESIFLGRETLERKIITRLFTDAFTLIAEVIESKTKPSLPSGDIGQDAFGNIPKFTDIGLMKRAILGIGLQDVLVSGLMPLLDIDILGASSDHIIIDAKQLEIKVGDTIGFNLNYGALLSAMTSPYLKKIYK